MTRRTTAIWLAIRGASALLLLVGMLTTLLSAASAQDAPGLVDDNQYESPQFDFMLIWSSPWELSADPESEEGAYDRIELNNGIAFIDAFLLIPTDEPQTYVDALVQNVEDEDPNYDVIDSGSGNDFVSTTVEFTFTNDDGSETLLRQYIESSDLQTQDGDEALFSSTIVAAADLFDEQWANLNESVERDGGDPLFRGTPAGIEGTSTGPGDEPTEEPTEEPSTDSGIDGDTFSGTNFGLTLEWDGDTWEAEDESDADDDRLVLTVDDSRLVVETITTPDGSLRDCVISAADLLEEEGYEDVARASDAPEPDAPDEAFGRVYSYTDTSGTRDVDYLEYVECRPIEGDSYVLIAFSAPADQYEDQLQEFSDVAETIEVAGPQDENGGPDENGTPSAGEPVLTDDSFTGGAFPISVTWDPDVWTAEMPDPAENYEAVRLRKDGNSIAIEAIADFDGDPDVCLESSLSVMEEAGGVSDFRENTQLDPPSSASAVSAAIVTNTVTLQGGDDIEALQYVECRELVAGESVIRVTSYMTEAGYEDELPFLEDVLSAIRVGEPNNNGPTDRPTEEPTQEPDNNGNTNQTDEDLPGVDGNEYTGPQHPFTISWDDTWEATGATSDDNGDSLTLTNGTSTVNILAGDFEREPTDCIDQFAAIAESFEGVENYAVLTNDDGEPQAETTANGAWSFFKYELDGDAYYDYIECSSARDDFVLAIIVQVPAAALASEQAAVQELLGSISLA